MRPKRLTWGGSISRSMKSGILGPGTQILLFEFSVALPIKTPLSPCFGLPEAWKFLTRSACHLVIAIRINGRAPSKKPRPNGEGCSPLINPSTVIAMMFTRQAQFLSEIASGEPIPEGKLAYLQARAKNRFYDYVLRKFLERERKDGFTRADLARRIGRRPEVITRLLGAPGNWTLETLCDLLAGISAEELEPHSTPLLGRPPRNFRGDEWLTEGKALSSCPKKVVVSMKTDGELEMAKPVPTRNSAQWLRP